jgi:hypothetical protein
MVESRLLRIMLLAALAVCGCSPWLRPPTADKGLPTPLMSPQTVVLEIAFVHLTPDDRATEAAIWRQLDEQALAVDLRQQLAGNGIRAGLAGGQLPEQLRSLVERTATELSQAPAGDDVTTVETASLARGRRMQVRAGKHGKIMVSTVLPSISVLAKDDQGRIHGDAFEEAQCLFSLLATPHGDGQATLQLTPEIEHGELKNRWVPIDGALVQQVGKTQQVYDHLRIQTQLSPGQTLVLGATDEAGGLAQHFFSVREPTPRRTLVLVRLAQTQQDDLFLSRESNQELSSVDE